MAKTDFGALTLLATLTLAACSEPANAPQAAAPAPAQPASVPAQAAAAPPPVPPAPSALPEAAAAINAAAFTPPAAPSSPPAGSAPKATPDPMLIRAQVLLDRARISPGVIDGLDGENMRQALAAFEAAHDLPSDGKLDAGVWQALVSADAAPVVQAYVVTAEDAAGPFTPDIPDSYDDMAKLERLGYRNVVEALAEKFHMDEDLLTSLNPGSSFAAGESVVVAAPGSDDLGVEVVSIEVDKAARAVRAFDAQGKLVALYPASVGSADLPAPSGTWAVAAVAPRPVYYYNPDRLSFGHNKASGKLQLKPGPNNPVGMVWIDLTKDTYGIHGTPEPSAVGKGQSHGCVRLANWDVQELGMAVKKGAKVVFVGQTLSKPLRKS